MKKLIKISILLVLCLVSMMFIACDACSSSDDPDVDVEEPIIATLSETEISLDLFQSKTLELNDSDGTITWTSKDPSIAIVSENGLVHAVAVGKTTVSAKYKEKDYDCMVTVTDSGARPFIIVASNTIAVKENKSFELDAKIKYLGEIIEGEFSYEVADPLIVEISNDGVLTGKKIGSTTITISSKINSYYTLPVLVNVTVVFDGEVKMSSNTVHLYTREVGGSIEQDINAEVYVRGQKVTSPTIIWSSENNEIAKYEAGKIKAVSTGKTSIIAKYEVEGVEISGTCLVDVEGIIGTFDDIDIDLNEVSGENYLIPFNAFDGEVAKITKFGAIKENIDFTLDGDKNILLNKTMLSGKMGENEYEFSTTIGKFTGKVTIATMVISNATEWSTFQNADNTGYYVLDNNIDFGGQDFLYQASSGNKTDTKWAKYFYGTLDGRGHTIKNVTLTNTNNQGIFERLFGTIKNIAFKNLNDTAVNPSLEYCRRNMLVFICDNGTIENVYVQGSRGAIKNGQFSGVIGQVVGTNSKVHNLVVDINETAPKTSVANVSAAIAGYMQTKSISNVISINKHYSAVGQPTGWSDPTSLVGIASYASLIEAENADITYSPEVWDSNIWDISGAIPVFRGTQVIGSLGSIDIDLSNASEYVNISRASITGDINAVYIASETIPYTVEGNNIKIQKTNLTNKLGVFNLEIEAEQGIYTGTITIATKVLSDATELTAFMTGDNRGYYVLDNEIDYNNNLFTYNATSGETTKPNDFYGTLDGRGHTIKNIKVSSGTRSGMFNELAEGATIKNIAFTNLVEQDAGAQYPTRNTFIWICRGNVENVYIDCTRLQIKGSYFGGVIGQVQSTGKVNKFVANITESTKGYGTHGGAIGGTLTKNVSNIVSISAHYPAVGPQDGWYGESHLTNIYTFTSISAAQSAGVKYSAEIWDTNLWDISGAIPIFKTAK